jgi:phage baseplate assembly protein W
MMFEGMNTQSGERLLTKVISAIKTWENRVTIDENSCRMHLDYDNNAVYLTIPYVINRNKITSVFNKKIMF